MRYIYFLNLTKKTLKLADVNNKFHQVFKEEIPVLSKFFQKIEVKKIHPKLFYEASIT